jgi:uncharacterized protein YycO
MSAYQTQTITIQGYGFGSKSPYNGDSAYINISDTTRGWNAGMTGNGVTLNIIQWTDSKIVISGFTGRYGDENWFLTPGDTVRIKVWNAVTGNGPASYTLDIPGSTSTWRENIRSGDIVLAPRRAMGWGHVGICYGTSYVIEAVNPVVNMTPIEKWDDTPGVYVLRVDCSNAVAAEAASLAYEQLGDAYQDWYLYLFPSSDLNSSMWYCSELVWAVYYNVGIDLEYTPDSSGPVTPWEIYMSTQVIYHYGPPDEIPD